MNAWILMWHMLLPNGISTNVVDQIETKESCEKLLEEIKKDPYLGGRVYGSCREYRVVSKGK
jgi:hypothetical protein